MNDLPPNADCDALTRERDEWRDKAKTAWALLDGARGLVAGIDALAAEPAIRSEHADYVRVDRLLALIPTHLRNLTTVTPPELGKP